MRNESTYTIRNEEINDQTSQLPNVTLPWDPLRARRSGAVILCSVVLERFASWSIITSVCLYDSSRDLHEQQAVQVQSWIGIIMMNAISCICSPFGGWLADSLIGRFWTIIVGMSAYITGFCLFTAVTINGQFTLRCEAYHTPNETAGYNMPSWAATQMESQQHLIHVYSIIVLTGFGVGLIRANIPPFGAEQFRASGENAVLQFFSAYYWCANVGSFMGIAIMAYVQQNFTDGASIACITATASLCVSLIVFSCGRRMYLVHHPRHVLVLDIFRSVAEGLFKMTHCVPHFVHPPQSHPSLQSSRSTAIISWIDRAKVSYGGSVHDTTVEDVKHLCRNLVFIALLLPFWCISFQVKSFFESQGLHMNTHLNDSLLSAVHEVPSAWFGLTDKVIVLFAVPLTCVFIYPWMGRINLGTSQRRIMFGLFASTGAILTAAVVERIRLTRWEEGYRVLQVIGGTAFNASGLSIAYQLPQYFLMGIAEFVFSVAGLEYVYTTSPQGFQGIVMGWYSAVKLLSSCLTTLVLLLIRPLQLSWIQEDVNKSRIDYLLFLLAAVQLMAILFLGLFFCGRSKPSRCDSADQEVLGTSACEYHLGRSDTAPSILAS